MATDSKMPKFQGYDDVLTPAVWLEKYAIFANCKGWTPAQSLNNVGLYLGEGPYLWYRQLPQPTRRNLQQLTAAFNAKYQQHDGLIWALRTQLSERRQMPDETVEAYAVSVEKLAAQLQLNDDATMEAFVRGLCPDLKAEAIKAHPTTLDEAINAARVAASLSTLANKSADDRIDKLVEGMTLLTQQVASMAPVTQNRQHQRRHTPPRQDQQRQTRPCGRCGKSGHISQHCFAKDSKCRACGRLGHYSRMCRSKYQNY